MTDERLLGPAVAGVHEHLRRGLESGMCAACGPAAGVWDRWAFVRLLETELRPSLRTERDLVRAMLDAIPRADAAHLWALGELLEAFADRLCELGRAGQRPADFTHTAENYRLAVQYWCNAVEAAVSRIRRGAAPAALVERLEEMAARESPVTGAY